MDQTSLQEYESRQSHRDLILSRMEQSLRPALSLLDLASIVAENAGLSRDVFYSTKAKTPEVREVLELTKSVLEDLVIIEGVVETLPPNQIHEVPELAEMSVRFALK